MRLAAGAVPPSFPPAGRTGTLPADNNMNMQGPGVLSDFQEYPFAEKPVAGTLIHRDKTTENPSRFLHQHEFASLPVAMEYIRCCDEQTAGARC